MKRKHLFEISDQPWCPRAMRQAATDFCRCVTEMSKAFHPIAPLLADAIRRSGATAVLDLGSGAAGPWLGLRPLLCKTGVSVPVCLSDYRPDLEAFAAHSRP